MVRKWDRVLREPVRDMIELSYCPFLYCAGKSGNFLVQPTKQPKHCLTGLDPLYSFF
jgi:hypothetical protein